MPISTITAKGQVTIPKAIRERLGLSEGDTLEFSIDDAGRIVARLQFKPLVLDHSMFSYSSRYRKYLHEY